ncbi:MAG: hypothetical protein Q7R31_01220 [Candidatus Levybacteria bacterium]|nr:hypothetical protein [Candidatus Levybacteria bacterium]
MAVETLKSPTSQLDIQKSVDLPIQRVTVATSSEFADKNHLVLLIDGKQEILVLRRKHYATNNVSSAIFKITGIHELYAVRSLVTEERKNLRVKASTCKNDNGSGSLTYMFDQKNFVLLINAVLPEMELFKPIPGDLTLPNGKIIPKSKHGLEDNFLHYILKKATKRPVKRSELAAKFRGGKSEEQALIRFYTLMHTTDERLESFRYRIRNTVPPGDTIRLGKQPEYILEPISNGPDIVKSKTSAPILPPPNKNLTLGEQEFIEKVKGQLALIATDAILSHMQAVQTENPGKEVLRTENLGQIEPNLGNFFLQWFSKRPHSRINFSDIIQHQENQVENFEKFFIRFFREVLESASAAPEYQSTQGLEANIITNYRELREKGYTVEGIVRKVCGHFRIEYEEPSKPTTSSPAN